jgi:ankyrin repeat protein
MGLDMKKPKPQRSADEYYAELEKSLSGDDPELLLMSIRKLKADALSYRIEGDDLLTLAIEHNCRNCILPLKNLGFDMNRHSPKSNKHTLEEAMDSNSMVVFEVLLRQGANPNAPHTRFGTVVHAAAATRLVDSLIPCLISRGGDPNAVAPDGSFPLQLAVQNSQVINVEQLLERGALINKIDGMGRTPLHLAVMLEQFDPIAYIVLDYGADPTVPDIGGVTPIDLAKVRKEAMLTKTLEDRANWDKLLNHAGPMGNKRPLGGEAFRDELLNAVSRGNRRAVYEYFAGRGGENWKPTGKQADSPLLESLHKGRYDMAAVIMGYGCGLHDRDIHQRNIAHFILRAGTNPAILLPFLKKANAANARYLTDTDKNGQSPVKAALAEGVPHDPEAIELLLNQAAKMDPIPAPASAPATNPAPSA